MKAYEAVVPRLMDICNERRLSQRGLANLAGIPYSTVESMRQGIASS